MSTKFARKLLLVEDEPLVASLLGEVLANEGFAVKIAHSALEADKLAAKFDPDIAVLDINLGHGPSGVDLGFILEKKYPGIALVFLTQHPSMQTAGYSDKDVPKNSGFVRKDLATDSNVVIRAIEDVVSSRNQKPKKQLTTHSLSALTAIQLEVLRMVAQGYTNSEIAKRRNTSSRAVELLLASIYSMLEINRDAKLNPRVEAVRRFIGAAGTPDRL